jgi:putative ABC transport system permease protein
MAALRLTRSLSVALVVGLGILVAVVLICTVPLYNALTINLQLQHALSSGDPQARNIWIVTHNARISPDERSSINPLVTSLGQRYVTTFTSAQPTFYVTASRMSLLGATGQNYDAPGNSHPQLTFEAFDYATTAPHMRFLAGGPPQNAASGTAPQVIITKEMADGEHLKVGDTITGAQLLQRNPALTFTVVGIWQPVQENDPYWNGLTFHANGSDTAPAIYPVLITYDTFYTQLQAFASLNMQQNWIYYTRSQAITTSNMGTVSERIGELRSHLNGSVRTRLDVFDVGVLTRLDTTLADLQAQQSLLALPLYVIVAQLVGLALYFVSAMAGLLIDSQRNEIVTLKSRGGSGMQLVGTFTLQGALLALIAMVAGPFLAVALSLQLLRWFSPPGALSQGGVSPSYLAGIASPTTVLVPALIGALLGIGALAFAVWQSARLDVLAFRREQGRSTQVAFWRRYYLDLGLAALCLLGYLELSQFGGAQTRQSASGGGASPLLLLTPALLLVAGALIVLRVLPIAARVGSRIAARGRGPSSLLAFAQVERNPARYSRMTLLLVLAVGLGLFALTFDASLNRNVHDRAAYTVGSDLRLSEEFSLTQRDEQAFEPQVAKLPGVVALSPAYRTQATIAGGTANVQVDVLGIDPATFSQVASGVSWNDNYAGSTSLPSLLAGLRAHEHGTNAGTIQAPIWAMVSSVFAAQNSLKVGDKFTLGLSESAFSSVNCVVGAIVQDFPTLYPNRLPGSFVVADLRDYLAAIRANSAGSDAGQSTGPNEIWLRTTGNAADEQRLLAALPTPTQNSQEVLTLRQQEAKSQANPVGVGMRGLLLVGAVTAALLAVLGSLAQSVVATRQRERQFAVLRTLGMSRGQLSRQLLSEQTTVFGFGLVGGTLLGLALVTATLPFLQFSDSTVDPATMDPATLGVPSYQVTFDPRTLAMFYGVLLLAFLVTLLLAARSAARIGLGNALRLGED